MALGVAAGVTAGGMVASLDPVLERPERYGAWWDVAVGQYSEEASLQAGIDAIRAMPGVEAAAGIYDAPSDARMDGAVVPIQAYEVYVGEPEPVMAAGRAPREPDEVALGRTTAERLGKHVGDMVRITNVDGSVDAGELTVTGIAVLANAVNSASNAGEGAYVAPELSHQMNPSVAQSIAVRVRSGPDRDATLEQLTALAAVTHVLLGLFRRHRGDLAILGATGLTRRQRLTVVAVSAGWLILVGAAVGLPLGVVGVRVVWTMLAEHISIPAHPVVGIVDAGLVLVGSMGLGLVIAVLAGRWQQRRAPAAILRTE